MGKILKRVSLRLYFQGQTVLYNGNQHIIETVFINGWDVYLKLSFLHDRVRGDEVDLENTIIKYYGNE